MAARSDRLLRLYRSKRSPYGFRLRPLVSAQLKRVTLSEAQVRGVELRSSTEQSEVGSERTPLKMTRG